MKGHNASKLSSLRGGVRFPAVKISEGLTTILAYRTAIGIG